MISRPTKDVDLVALMEKGHFVSAKSLPKPLQQAILDVSSILKIRPDWINAEPSDLFTMGLPEGFADRMTTRHFGGLTLHLAGRFDQICFKLYATADQEPGSKHFQDLKSLKPTKNELEQAARWCKTHDVSPEFATILNEILHTLGS